MAKASIHFEYNRDIAVGYFYHNTREKPTVNSIFSTDKNITNTDAKTATKRFYNELGKRIVKYEKRMKRKLPSNTIKHISGIFNINEDTSIKDIKKFIKYLEQELDTKIIQWAIHKDEGHISQLTGEKVLNAHVHIEMLGLDSQGKSVRQKLKKWELMKLQKKAAEILHMEKGEPAAKTKAKHIPHWILKKIKKQQEEELLALKKELQNKDEIIKNNEEIIQKQEKEIKELKQENEQLKIDKEQKKEAIQLLKNVREDIKNINKIIQLFTAQDYKKISEIQKKIRKDNINEIKELKDSIKALIKYFESKLKQYEQENMQLLLEQDNLINQLTNLKQSKAQEIRKAKEKLNQYSDYDFGIN